MRKFASFVIGVEVSLVLSRNSGNVAAEAPAIAVVFTLRPPLTAEVTVPSVGIQRRVLEVLVSRAVKSIRAAFGHQQHLASRRAAETGIRIVGRNPEFLDALGGRGNRSFRTAAEVGVVIGIARDAIGNVAAVEQDGVLIALRSGDLSAERAALIALLQWCRGRLQEQ